MKNLYLKNSKVLFNQSILNDCSHITLNNESENFYFAKATTIYQLNRNVVAEFDLKKVLSNQSDSHIIGIKVILDQFKLFVAMSNGDLFLADYKLENFELVAMINGGVLSFSWSSDMELCVIFTCEDIVILLTADFDILREINLKEIVNPSCTNVNVGWGSKETQFHGSEGKKAATKCNQIISPKVASFDDCKSSIAWREDGQFFLIGYVDSNIGCRRFQIFSREGVLHSFSNDDVVLGSAICFGPNNNLITTCNYHDDIAEICFFEMNALSHGQFTIPFKNINVQKVQFNNNNSILAILFQTNKAPISYKVVLYTTSNYHWYMKQCLDFEEEGVVNFYWDDLIRNQMYVFTTKGRVLSYFWMSGYFPVEKSTATCVVYDASDLLITPFNLVTIPPPMCAYTLHLPTPIVTATWKCTNLAAESLTNGESAPAGYYTGIISINEEDEFNQLLVLTSDNLLHLFSYLRDSKDLNGKFERLGFKEVCSPPNLISTFKFVEGFITFPLSIRHLNFVTNSTISFIIFEDEKEFVFIANMNKNLKSIEIVHKIEISTESNLKAAQNDSKNFVLCVDITSGCRDLIIEMQNRQCWILNIETGIIKPFLAFNQLPLVLQTPCSIIKSLKFQNQEAIIGLSETYRLFINEIELAQDCSSFVINENYILWTTNSHLLKSVDRQLFYKAKVTLGQSLNEEKRNVERGSQIVTTFGTKVILQMPRGNLEVIHPRVLVLHNLKIHLDKLQYMEGFKLCRHHRINMNILADHNFEIFLSNVKLFVQQLDSTDNINIFLAALIKDDVTYTMYKNFYFAKQSPNNWPKKLDDICNQIQTILIELDQKKYFISIITCDLKKLSPDLESALKRIKAVKEIDAALAVSAVKYLFYLGDAMNIYRVALATYDLQLAVIVAEQSQMDPKDYLVELNKFGLMDEDFMKYSIDIQLKKYEKALESLVKCGDDHYDECLKLINEHKLFSKALSLYPTNSKQYKDICILYAAKLGEDKNFSESGILYFRVGEFQVALSKFEDALRWEMCLCCAAELKFDAKQVNQLATRLATKLVENHMHLEAATLLETYANDFEEAVVVLISGYKWDEALRLIYKYNRLDLIETNLKPSLLESAQCQVNDLDKINKEFNTHLLRLNAVREEKNAEKNMDVGGGAMNDMLSDTSSVTGDTASQVTSDSRTSKNSNKSKKSARKRKWSLRKGSANEHIALVEALYNIIDRTHKTIVEDVKTLTNTLLLFQKESLALDLQEQMSTLFETIEKSMDTIWPQTFVNMQATNYNYGPTCTSNSISASLNKKSDQNDLSIKSDSNYKDMPFMVRPILKQNVWKNIIINNLQKIL